MAAGRQVKATRDRIYLVPADRYHTRMGTMARRGLTPLLVLLVVAPPRVCTCDHAHAESIPIACLADPPEEDHRHDHDDPDCPCLKPAQLGPTILAAGMPATPPPALHLAIAVRPAAGHADDAPAPPARRTGDPPLYLTGCALRF